MSVQTNNKEVKKAIKIKNCISAQEKGDDPTYHICRFKENHEGQHRCCACPTTWD